MDKSIRGPKNQMGIYDKIKPPSINVAEHFSSLIFLCNVRWRSSPRTSLHFLFSSHTLKFILLTQRPFQPGKEEFSLFLRSLCKVLCLRLRLFCFYLFFYSHTYFALNKKTPIAYSLTICNTQVR